MRNYFYKNLFICFTIVLSVQVSAAQTSLPVDIQGIAYKIEGSSALFGVIAVGQESLKLGESAPKYKVDLSEALFYKVSINKKVPTDAHNFRTAEMVTIKGTITDKTIKAREVLIPIQYGKGGIEVDPAMLSTSTPRLVGTVVEKDKDTLKIVDVKGIPYTVDVSKSFVRRGHATTSPVDIQIGDLISSEGTLADGFMISSDLETITPPKFTKYHEFNQSMLQKIKNYFFIKVHALFLW